MGGPGQKKRRKVPYSKKNVVHDISINHPKRKKKP